MVRHVAQEMITHIRFMTHTAHVVFYHDVIHGFNTWGVPPTAYVRQATEQEQTLLNVVALAALHLCLWLVMTNTFVCVSTTCTQSVVDVVHVWLSLVI